MTEEVTIEQRLAAIESINGEIFTVLKNNLDKVNDKEPNVTIEEPNEEDNQSLIIRELITQRDVLVQEFLQTAPKDVVRSFAEQELQTNQKIVEMVQILLDTAKDEVTLFVRSRSAIKKYK